MSSFTPHASSFLDLRQILESIKWTDKERKCFFFWGGGCFVVVNIEDWKYLISIHLVLDKNDAAMAAICLIGKYFLNSFFCIKFWTLIGSLWGFHIVCHAFGCVSCLNASLRPSLRSPSVYTCYPFLAFPSSWPVAPSRQQKKTPSIWCIFVMIFPLFHGLLSVKALA